MDVRVLVVPADEETRPFVKTLVNYDYTAGQQIVGGLIQPVTVERADVTIWANEEGLMHGLPFNRRTTSYLYLYAQEHRGYTMLVGDVYFTDLPDNDGDTTCVPDRVVQDLLA